MKVIVEPPAFPLDAVRSLFGGADVIVEAPPRPWSGDDVVGLLVWQTVAESDMSRLPGLRIIVTGSIGFDNIDIEAARRRGIWVCNIPDYCIDEVADTTIALLLSLVRGVVTLDRSVRSGRWDDHAAGRLPRVSDVRLGVIGFGRIGRAVAQRAMRLGMRVMATDPVVGDDEIAATGAAAGTLDAVLRQCNAVTLHLPLGTATERLIGARELAMLPHGAYLVNTARGPLVDMDALVAALNTGQLAGAAIDVLPSEPPTRDEPAPRHPRLVVTPHAAWYSPTAEREVIRRGVASMQAILGGRAPDRGVVVAGEKLSID